MSICGDDAEQMSQHLEPEKVVALTINSSYL